MDAPHSAHPPDGTGPLARADHAPADQSLMWVSTPAMTLAVKVAAITIELASLWQLRRTRPWSLSHKCLAAVMACFVVGDVGDVMLGGWREPTQQDSPTLLALRLSYRLAMASFCALVLSNGSQSIDRRTWMSPQLWLGFLVAAPFDCCSIAALLTSPITPSFLLLCSEFLYHTMFLFTFALGVIILASVDDPAWFTYAAGTAQGAIATLGVRATRVLQLDEPPVFYELLWTVAILVTARGTALLAQGVRPLPSLCARSLYRTVKTLLLAAMFAALIPLFSFEDVTKRTIQIACLLANAGIGVVTLLAYAFHSLDRAFLAAVERALQSTAFVVPQLPHPSLPIEHQQALEVIVSHHTEHLRTQAKREARLKTENARMKAKQEISRQVAHDIRSPLAALDVAIAQPEVGRLPDAVRDLVRLAAQRIRDIANDLVQKQGPVVVSQASAKTSTDCHLALVVEAAVSEKRAEISRDGAILVHYDVDPSTHALFVRAAKAELSRVLSNLLNNAIEASEADAAIHVAVTPPLPDRPDVAQVVIADRGSGIDPSILASLGVKRVSLGKRHGQGFGLLHARQALSHWGGQLFFRSRHGGGTEVIAQLPRTDTPAWFCRHICFSRRETVIVVDDDPSIHRLWRARLKPFVDTACLSLLHASTLCDFTRLIDRTQAAGTRRQFLVDQEFAASMHAGLDVVAAQGVAAQTILVTSHDHQPSIQRQCRQQGTLLLPKALAPTTPLLLRRDTRCQLRARAASPALAPTHQASS